MKQKALRLLVPFLLLALLVGCGDTETSGKAEPRSVDVDRSYTHYYNSLTAAETEDTIYFVGTSNSFISYVDKATGVGGILCGKPECLHNNEDCNAFLANRTDKLFIEGDRLCWIDSMPEYIDGQWLFSICSMALDGTDRKEVRRLDEKYFSRKGSGGVPYYAYYGGVIYYAIVTVEIEDGEDTYYNYVCAIPTDPDQEPTVLLHERTGFSNIILLHFYDGYLYVVTDNTSNFGTAEDETGLSDYRLRRINVETREMETLYEDLESTMIFPLTVWATDECVYFSRELAEADGDRTYFYRYDFATGACEPLSNPDPEDENWCLADELIAGYKLLSNNHDGTYDVRITLRDFAGETLVDETYSLDLGYPYYNNASFHFTGRDENYAYFHFATTYGAPQVEGVNMLYTSMIAVALDGSGVRELCTVSNNAP